MSIFTRIWDWIKGEPVLVGLIGTEVASLASLIPTGAPPAVAGAVAIVEAVIAGIARQSVTPMSTQPPGN